MVLQTCLSEAMNQLEAVGVETARLDALVLLEDVTGIDRAQILAEPDCEVPIEQQTELTKLLKRRATHEPLAYIRGHAEFYGRTFVVNRHVLVPRPETETMIDLLRAIFRPDSDLYEYLLKFNKYYDGASKDIKIADVGTGCGAIGITAYEELKSKQNVVIELIDIDKNALTMAKNNVVNYSAPILSKKSDLLTDASTKYDVLLCNLPYIPKDYVVNKSAQFEPKIALYAGQDGLDFYRRLFKQARTMPYRPLLILTESLPMQHQALQAIAQHNGYELVQVEGFIQVFAASQNTD